MCKEAMWKDSQTDNAESMKLRLIVLFKCLLMYSFLHLLYASVRATTYLDLHRKIKTDGWKITVFFRAVYGESVYIYMYTYAHTHTCILFFNINVVLLITDLK